MGFSYLSCKAESSISNSHSTLLPPPQHNHKPIKIQHFQYSDLEAATNGFSDQKLLGKGSHGCVYKAVLHGRHVAVKKPSRDNLTEVDNEIEILSRIHHPRLVNLVGFTIDDDDSKKTRKPHRLLVVEFMSNGTLYDVLHSTNAMKTPPATPNWGRRIRMALQTARAIEILHNSNPPIMHRDIKSANILIDRNFNARLSDFGLAIRGYVDDSRVRSTPPAGTMGYLDPSYVTADNLSTKSDVFSFGILLLEMISGRKAIDVGYSPPSIVDWAIPLIRKGKLFAIYDPRILPPKDPIVRKQMTFIAAKCVRSCRERRPSMKEVADWLSGLSKLVPLHSWNGFNNPCMMVETMGNPIDLKNGFNNPCKMVENMGNPVVLKNAHLNLRHNNANGDGVDGNDKYGRLAMRNSRRVYSDLGFRNNLMDLMAENNEDDQLQTDEKDASHGSNLRFGSGRIDVRSKTQCRKGNLGGKIARSSVGAQSDI